MTKFDGSLNERKKKAKQSRKKSLPIKILHNIGVMNTVERDSWFKTACCNFKKVYRHAVHKNGQTFLDKNRHKDVFSFETSDKLSIRVSVPYTEWRTL